MDNLTGDDNPFTHRMDPRIDFCQSRHTNPVPEAVAEVVDQGDLLPLLNSNTPSPVNPTEPVGPAAYATADHSAVFNLGHFEYAADTIDSEIRRDKAKNIHYPVHNYYGQGEAIPSLSWKSARTLFFGNFLNTIYLRMNQHSRPVEY